MKTNHIITYSVALLSLGFTQAILPAQVSAFDAAIDAHLFGQPPNSNAEARVAQAVVRQKRANVRLLQDAVAGQKALNVVLKHERSQRAFEATEDQDRHLRQKRSRDVMRRARFQQGDKDAITGEGLSEDSRHLVVLFPGERGEVVVSLHAAVTALLVGRQWGLLSHAGLDVKGRYKDNRNFVDALSAASDVNISALLAGVRTVLSNPENVDESLKDLVKILSNSELFKLEMSKMEELIENLFAGHSIATSLQAFKFIQAFYNRLRGQRELSDIKKQGYALVLNVLPEIIAQKVRQRVQFGL